jgi:hypothetical protein
MVAAGEGRDKCVLVLASNGADVNMVDRVSQAGVWGRWLRGAAALASWSVYCLAE